LKKQPLVTFANPARLPFAVAMIDCWLANGDRTLPTEAILAETFGHPSVEALHHASGNWSPDARPYGPEVRDALAWTLSSIVGRPAGECARFLDLLNAEGNPVDEDGVLGWLSERYAGSKYHDGIVGFFSDFPFLLDEADLAVRLRKAGKQDLGAEAAMEQRHMDVLDAVNEVLLTDAPVFSPVPAMALYYACALNETVANDWFMHHYDHNPSLLGGGKDTAALAALLRAAKGYPAGAGLDFRTFSDLVREPELPTPSTHEEIRSAVAVHRALREPVNEFFGLLHPFHALPASERPGSWQALEAAVRRDVDFEVMEAGRARLENFVRAYVEDEGQDVFIAFDDWNVMAMARECRMLVRADDAGIARYLAVDGGRCWSDHGDDRSSIGEAVARFTAGCQKRHARPEQDGPEGWRDDPEIHRAGEDAMAIARGRKR